MILDVYFAILCALVNGMWRQDPRNTTINNKIIQDPKKINFLRVDLTLF